MTNVNYEKIATKLMKASAPLGDSDNDHDALAVYNCRLLGFVTAEAHASPLSGNRRATGDGRRKAVKKTEAIVSGGSSDEGRGRGDRAPAPPEKKLCAGYTNADGSNGGDHHPCRVNARAGSRFCYSHDPAGRSRPKTARYHAEKAMKAREGLLRAVALHGNGQKVDDQRALFFDNLVKCAELTLAED